MVLQNGACRIDIINTMSQGFEYEQSVDANNTLILFRKKESLSFSLSLSLFLSRSLSHDKE